MLPVALNVRQLHHNPVQTQREFPSSRYIGQNQNFCKKLSLVVFSKNTVQISIFFCSIHQSMFRRYCKLNFDNIILLLLKKMNETEAVYMVKHMSHTLSSNIQNNIITSVLHYCLSFDK